MARKSKSVNIKLRHTCGKTWIAIFVSGKIKRSTTCPGCGVAFSTAQARKNAQ
jgi:hypothetical protein